MRYDLHDNRDWYSSELVEYLNSVYFPLDFHPNMKYDTDIPQLHEVNMTSNRIKPQYQRKRGHHD